MSDHPREAVRHLKRLNVCNDVWYNVFPFVDHNSLGLGLALSSCRFNVLVDKYFERAKWSLGPIEICRASNGNGMEIQKRHRMVPMANTPLPPQIVGFKYILISYIDHTVFAFLRRIQPIFSSNIALNIHIQLAGIRAWHAMGMIWPLLDNSISYLTLNSRQLSGLQFVTSVTVLRDCANLRGIEFHKDQFFGDIEVDSDYEDMDGDGEDIQLIEQDIGDYDDAFDQEMDGIMANLANNAAAGDANGEGDLYYDANEEEDDDEFAVIAIDNVHHQQQQQLEMAEPFAWPGRPLFQWLHKGREDGRPKLLKYVDHGCITPLDMAPLKEAFINNQSSPISYIIRLETHLVDIEPFEVKNERTGEQLTLRHFFSNLWLLERGPIGRDESDSDLDRVALKCGWEEHQNGMINIAVYTDRDVGPLSMPAAEDVQMD